MLIQMEV